MARGVSYGTINVEMVGRWLELPPEADSPFWAVNLMKYKERAAYADGADHGLTGREADDAYAPVEQLAAVGAMVAFHGDVIDHIGEEPRWERIGIVRYPSRRAFFEMQARDDFKRQHEHKSAGMDVTIVMASAPSPGIDARDADGPLVVRVLPSGSTVPPIADGAERVLVLDVEGVIVGDERTWSSVVFDVARDVSPATLAADAGEGAITMVVERDHDRLVDSIGRA